MYCNHSNTTFLLQNPLKIFAKKQVSKTSPLYKHGYHFIYFSFFFFLIADLMRAYPLQIKTERSHNGKLTPQGHSNFDCRGGRGKTAITRRETYKYYFSSLSCRVATQIRWKMIKKMDIYIFFFLRSTFRRIREALELPRISVFI